MDPNLVDTLLRQALPGDEDFEASPEAAGPPRLGSGGRDAKEVMAHPWVVGDGTDLPWGTPEAVCCAEEMPSVSQRELSEGGGPAEAVSAAVAAGSAIDPAQHQVAGATSSEPEEESGPGLECEPSPSRREPDAALAAAALLTLDMDSMSLNKAFQL